MSFRVAEHIAQQITYKPWRNLKIDLEYDIRTRQVITVVSMRCPDAKSESPNPERIPVVSEDRQHRDFFDDMTQGQIVEYFYDLIRELEMHETAEWFRVAGRLAYDPHT